MKLILMRHAEAEPADPERYPDDDLRPLTVKGRGIQAKVAKAFKRMELKPDRIITSPRLRTLQTADITANKLCINHVLTQDDALGRHYSVASVLAMLASFDPSDTVMCVGHDPDLTELGGVLLGMTTRSGIKFPKSGVMGIQFSAKPSPAVGVLRFFYRSRDLLALL